MAVNFRTYLLLVHFDQIVGPEILFCSSSLNPGDPIEKKIGDLIPNLLDITAGKSLSLDPFIFASSDIQSQNAIFSIAENQSRGGKKDYLISFIITPASQSGLMGIMGLETFFLSFADEFITKVVSLHEILEFKSQGVNKSNLLNLSNFEDLSSQLMNYYENIQTFLQSFLTQT